MITFETFRDEFLAVQEDILRDYKGDDDKVPAACNILHQDVQLDETPVEDAEEKIERVREVTGQIIEPDVLELTKEHHQLHEFLSVVQREAMLVGVSAPSLLATMFVIGRRYGMREAAQMFEGLNVPD